ncbi:hypothetical protein ACFL56_03850 [Candidatus Margulisiibacteriota bacterium]
MVTLAKKKLPFVNCPYCNEKIEYGVTTCSHCKLKIPTLKTISPFYSVDTISPPKKSFVQLHLFLKTLVCAGWGHYILGQKKKAYILIGITIALTILTKGFFTPFFNIVMAADILLLNRKLMNKESIGVWESFPISVIFE